MSPVDPLPPLASPTSPMDISPTSAIEAGLMIPINSPKASESVATSVAMPAAPALAASDTLPRLVTTFQNSHLRRISSEVQFALLTPSPLTLRSGTWSQASSPKTAISAAKNGRPFGIRYEDTSRSPMLAETAMNISFNGSGSHRRQFSGSSMTSDVNKPPTLCRQNAMEGIENMDIDEALPASKFPVAIRLPIRSNRPSANQTSSHSRKPFSKSTHSSHSSSSTTTILSQNTITSTKPTTCKFPPKHTRSPAISKPLSPPRSTGRKNQRTRPSTPKPKLTSRNSPSQKAQSQKQAHLRALITHLSHPLVPLVSVKTGQPHPDFPRTLLSYNLLTHAQLDSLARHYHQTLDAGEERWLYPAPIAWGKVWRGRGSHADPATCADAQSVSESAVGGTATGTKRQLVSLEAKRRRWGRFIGLRGCESPVTVAVVATSAGTGDQQHQEEEEDIAERMERQWREALRRAEEERNVRDKLWGRKF